MSVQIRGSSGNIADVTAANESKVILPTSISKAGYVALSAMADVAGQVRIPITGSTQGLLAVTQPFWDFEEGFAASAISASKWQQTLSTMTVAVANNAVTLNSGSSVASGAVARISSYRHFRMLRAADRIFAVRTMLPNKQTGAVYELGAFLASGTSAPTAGVFFRYGSDGTLFGVAVSVSGSEVSTSEIPAPSYNVAHDYSIRVGTNIITFEIDNVIVGTINIGDTAPSIVTSESAPIAFRLYNASATGAAQLAYIYKAVSASIGADGYDQAVLAAMAGDIGTQGVVGGSTGSLANWANSAAPASATLSNTAAGYTTIGGQFQFAAVAGAETDYALFGFQVPAHTATNQARTLIIRGVTIDTFNTGAAVATTPTVLQWGIGYGSTAVSLATADGAATKAPRRIPLGVQVLPVSTPIGGAADKAINVKFNQPIPINSGEFGHIILKMPVGTATASQIVRGVVGIDATWE